MQNNNNKIRVRIERCSGSRYWYKNEIGAEYDVYEDDRNYNLCEDQERHIGRIIQKSDCEVITAKTPTE